MIRFIKRLFTIAVTLALLVSFGYCVALPRVLPLKYQDFPIKALQTTARRREIPKGFSPAFLRRKACRIFPQDEELKLLSGKACPVTVLPSLQVLLIKMPWQMQHLFLYSDEDFLKAKAYFTKRVKTEILDEESLKSAQCVLARCAVIEQDYDTFFSYCLHNIADGKASAEICYELGNYYKEKGNVEEASMWFYNAAYEAESQCNIHYSGDYPRFALATCLELLGDSETAEKVRQEAQEWEIPEGLD